MKERSVLIIIIITVILLISTTLVASANGGSPTESGWCLNSNLYWRPCAGANPWDPYYCGAPLETCRYLVEVCRPGVGTVTVPSFLPPTFSSNLNFYYPTGACPSNCTVLQTHQDRLGRVGGPPQFTKVIYRGSCTDVVAVGENGYRFTLPGGLWFNEDRDFQLIDFNGEKVKQSWFTNPGGSGQYQINIYGSNGVIGGYLNIQNP